MCIFAGIGLGCLVSRSTKLRDELFIAAAEALAKMVTDDDRAAGSIYPPIGPIRSALVVSGPVLFCCLGMAHSSGCLGHVPREGLTLLPDQSEITMRCITGSEGLVGLPVREVRLLTYTGRGLAVLLVGAAAMHLVPRS